MRFPGALSFSRDPVFGGVRKNQPEISRKVQHVVAGSTPKLRVGGSVGFVKDDEEKNACAWPGNDKLSHQPWSALRQMFRCVPSNRLALPWVAAARRQPYLLAGKPLPRCAGWLGRLCRCVITPLVKAAVTQ